MRRYLAVNFAELLKRHFFRGVDGVALRVVVTLRHTTLFLALGARECNEWSIAFFGHADPF